MALLKAGGVMTKSDLIDILAKRGELTKGVAEIVIDTILDSMSKALDAGEKIELRGFGSFRMKTREARIGRNPKTGEKVRVPSRRAPSFRVGKELKESINGRTNKG